MPVALKFTLASTVEPYRSVGVTFTGTVLNGQLAGSYAIGSNGVLPGRQPITYSPARPKPRVPAQQPCNASGEPGLGCLG